MYCKMEKRCQGIPVNDCFLLYAIPKPLDPIVLSVLGTKDG